MLKGMRMSRGFTLIEILVTISIMVILLTLAVANLRSTQVQARDTERRNDAESIARGLEERYNLGNTTATLPAGYVNKGSYPGNNEIVHMMGCERSASPEAFTPTKVQGGYLTAGLPGTTEKSLTSPGKEDVVVWNVSGCEDSSPHSIHPACVDSCQPAENLTQINTALTAAADRYVYEPYYYDASNQKLICSGLEGGCRGFNLYWRSEADLSTFNVIKSKWR